jgi:hypothetical protein
MPRFAWLPASRSLLIELTATAVDRVDVALWGDGGADFRRQRASRETLA